METILIAVGDGVLADSLRFSLELEGFETRFCDEHSFLAAIGGYCGRAGCLVLDQDVFSRVVEGEETGLLPDRGMPVILLVSHGTKGVLARAAAAGVTEVIEKPLLGGMLCDAIRHAIGQEHYSGEPRAGERPAT